MTSKRGVGPIPSGFTLMEMIVTLAIVMILIVVLASSILSARQKSRALKCMNNQHQLMSAVMMFGLDNERYPGTLYPTPTDPADAIMNYYHNEPEITRCPTVEGTFRSSPSVYSYALLGDMRGVNLSSINNAAQTLVVIESDVPVLASGREVAYRHMGGSIGGFADGHIELLRNVTIVTASQTETPINGTALKYPIIFDTDGFLITFNGPHDNGNGTTTYRFELTNNNARPLNWVLFSLPDGVEPVNYQGGDQYRVHVLDGENPGADYIRFKSTWDTIQRGESDWLEYTLSNQDIQNYPKIEVRIKAQGKAQANVTFD